LVRQNTKNQLTRPRFYWVEEIGFGGCDKSGKARKKFLEKQNPGFDFSKPGLE